MQQRVFLLYHLHHRLINSATTRLDATPVNRLLTLLGFGLRVFVYLCSLFHLLNL